MQSEIRQNLLTGKWVIIAPERGERPEALVSQQNTQREQRPSSRESCPFCPGNESMLPDILDALPSPAAWQTRVVPNKFPALRPDPDPARSTHGIYRAVANYGKHEVIIEHPLHDRDLAQMSLPETDVVIETYHRRYHDLMTRHDDYMLCLIFRNHGPRSGASLTHPHSQLVVTDIVPHDIRWREQTAQRHFDQHGRCALCAIMAYELEAGQRVVSANESLVAFVPYAAEVPFELWIVPRRHQASFSALSDRQKPDLAHILSACLRRLHTRLDDPDYNYIIQSAAQYHAGQPHLHWYLQIRPRLVTPAGFEIGSGVHINPSVPENDAEFLRQQKTTSPTE